ncbi:hypothetical protein ACLOJK_027549 [Asimina triloba]
MRVEEELLRRQSKKRVDPRSGHKALKENQCYKKTMEVERIVYPEYTMCFNID